MVKHISKKLKMKKSSDYHSSEKYKTASIQEKSSTDDRIMDYLNLCTNFEYHITEYRNSWKVTLEENLVFYKVEISDYPIIVASIKIDKNLKVEAFTEHGKVKKKILKYLLNLSSLVLKYWSQLKSLLKYFENENKNKQHISIKHNLTQSMKYLKNCEVANSEESIGLKAKLEFILGQIEALVYNRYAPNMLFIAYSIYLKSSACYKYIQSLDSLILPTEEELLKNISDTDMNMEEKM